MRARIYIRVSTEEQVEGYSLEVQEERCRAFIISQGWTVEGLTADEGYSGYYATRPGITELISDAGNQKFDIICVYKLDRFSRKLKDLVNITDQLEELGIALKSVTEPFDTLTSHGKLQFQILGSFAEFERNRIKERVFPGMVKGVEKGHWQGGRYAPYGYTYNKNKKMLLLVSEEATAVELIFGEAAQGHSISAIARRLKQADVVNERTGQPFQTSLITRILRNPIYTGKIVWNRYGYSKKIRLGKTYLYEKKPQSQHVVGVGSHKPLISEEEFEYVQLLLDDKAILRGKGAIGRHRDSEHILSGVIFCSCGLPMYGDRAISNHAKKIYKRRYRCCSTVRYGASCGNKTIYADVVEGEVIKIIGEVTGSPQFIDDLLSGLQKELIDHDPAIGLQIKRYKTQYDLNRKKIETLIREAIDPLRKLEPELINKVYAEIRAEQEEIEKEMEKLREKATRAVSRETVEKFFAKIENFADYFRTFDNETKRSVVKTVLERITITDGQIAELSVKDCFKNSKGVTDKDGEEKSRVHLHIRLPDERTRLGKNSRPSF